MTTSGCCTTKCVFFVLIYSNILELFHIQVFVETLDKCFENVCELDLIFHVDKVSLLHHCTWLPHHCAIILIGAQHLTGDMHGRDGARDQHV